MEYITLKEIAEITMGQSPDSKTYNEDKEGIPFYQGKSDFGKLNPVPRVWCSKPVKIAKKNDILISVRAPIGDTNITREQCCIGRGLASIRPINSTNINDKYLYYLINSKYNELNKFGTGSTFKAITKDSLCNLKCKKVPDINIQIEIAKKLDMVNRLIEIRKKQIESLNTLIKSQFVEMFGDINTNEMNWNSDVLKRHLKVVGGYAFKSKEFKDNGIPILRIGNINAGYFKPKDLMFWQEEQKLHNYVIYPNDLVMSLTGTVGKEDYGNVCIMGNDFEKYYLNQRNAKLILADTLNKFYITYALRVKEIKKRLTGISRGVRQANIANKDIENLNIPIPPIELQNQFAEIVKQIDKQKFEIEQSLKETEELYETLMAKYFE